jgi:hypothetical protein
MSTEEMIFMGVALFFVAVIIRRAFENGMGSSDPGYTGLKPRCPPHKWEYIVEGKNAIQCRRCGGKPVEDLRGPSDGNT